LAGTYNDTYSLDVEPPGYKGSGAGRVLSETTAEMTFELVRWDGKTVQPQCALALSEGNSTLTLCCDVGSPIILRRQ
jgi:hypothetical protein